MKNFGIMNHLSVALCPTAEDASQRGYHREAKYKDAKPITISEVVIVKDGTLEHNSTVDFVLEDEAGNKFVVMVTGRLIKSLPL
jgi:hypothetical protein